jgi:Uma2 family endonuclease
MSSTVPDMLLEVEYAEYAREYLRKLPLEHFMEAKPQAVQREITLASLALVKTRRPDVHVYNEMLVQYPRSRRRRPGQVVPDNMVVIHAGTLDADESYDVPLQPARPFWVLEYVSRRSKGKDYKDSFHKYERELKVPYCLFFRPEKQELRLHHHEGRRYVRLKANSQGRYEVAELELEVGLLGGWVRFWYQGQLLPLPAELQARLDEAERRAEREKERAEQEKQRAEQEKQRAEREKQRADILQRQVEEEKRARLAAERKLEQLRARRGKNKNQS